MYFDLKKKLEPSNGHVVTFCLYNECQEFKLQVSKIAYRVSDNPTAFHYYDYYFKKRYLPTCKQDGLQSCEKLITHFDVTKQLNLIFN